jgi:hypothetical protein
MSLSEQISALVGDWSGENRLWLEPASPVDASAAAASVALVAQGRYLTLRYSWAAFGEVQEGLLLAGVNSGSGEAQAAWVDSFHTADSIMNFTGEPRENGGFLVKTMYPAPDGPDWGWWIELEPINANQFVLKMYNVMPENEPYVAVEAKFSRIAGS